MTPAFRNVLILVLALIAGVVTQEVVQKFTAANDEPEQAAVACPALACPVEYADSDAEPQPAEPPASDTFVVATSPATEMSSLATDSSQDVAEPVAAPPSDVPDPAPAPPETRKQPPATATTTATEPTPPSVPHPEPAKSEIRIIPPPSTEKLLVDKTEPTAPETKPSASAKPVKRPVAPRVPKYSASPALTDGRLPSPQELVRERAIARDVERRKRIEFRKSLGFMPLRPAISANVHMGGSHANPTMFFLPYVVTERRGEPSLGARYLDGLRRD